MEIDILEEKENVFFNRKDLKLKIKHANLPTPSKSELIKLLSEKYSLHSSQIIIDYIFTKKGLAESFAKVKILKEKIKEGERAEA